jgi:hypothetical protein
MTNEQLKAAYTCWSDYVKTDPHEVIDSGDDYYWRGAQSFYEYLLNNPQLRT